MFALGWRAGHGASQLDKVSLLLIRSGQLWLCLDTYEQGEVISVYIEKALSPNHTGQGCQFLHQLDHP